MNIAYLLLYAFIFTACVTKGRPFPSDLGWIAKEVTKKDDVLLLLGRPFMVGSAGGIMTWSYGRYNYNLIGRDYIKELKIYWNDDNTVRDYSFQSSFPSDMRKAGVITKDSPKAKRAQKKRKSSPPLIDKGIKSVIDEDLDLETMLEGSPVPEAPVTQDEITTPTNATKHETTPNRETKDTHPATDTSSANDPE